MIVMRGHLEFSTGRCKYIHVRLTSASMPRTPVESCKATTLINQLTVEDLL
jgi:hypothetical protein